jgi:hypothetical protein
MKKPNAQHDLRLIAFHEAGHLVVARHFGLDGHIVLQQVGKATRQDKAWIGHTGYQGRLTPHKRSVIGWAGLLGEALVSDPELLDFESLFVCHMPFDDMSDTDREAICAQGTAPGTAWRNFEEAYRILKGHRSKVIRVVRALLGKRAILPRSQGRLRCFPIRLASQAPIVMTGPTRPGRTG